MSTKAKKDYADGVSRVLSQVPQSTLHSVLILHYIKGFNDSFSNYKNVTLFFKKAHFFFLEEF